MPANPTMKREPLEAGPVRRVVHTLMALAGWVVFVYWWWLVFRRVNATEVRYTLWFIAIALVVIVFVTVLWAIHNARLFRKRGPRTQVRLVREDFSRDTVGRLVNMPAVPADCLNAGIIVVRIEGEAKVYRPIAARFVARRAEPPRVAS